MSPLAAVALLILVPLVAAALAFALPRLGHTLALGTAGATGWAAVVLARHVHDNGSVVCHLGGWKPPLGIQLRADGQAVLLLLISAGLGVAVTIYARRYFACSAAVREARPAANRERYFWPLFLFLGAALNALFLSADIFNLYVTLELLSFAAVMLTALTGERAAVNAAMRYLLVSLAGSLFYLLGVAMAYGGYSTVDLALLAERVRPGAVSWTALALMTAGLVMKAALFPMHFWLPPAHANAPAPVSALLSALVIKGAYCILLRLWLEAFAGVVTPMATQCLAGLGGAAVLWGSFQALRQARLKMLVAYSTVAQLGYLFLVFPLVQGGRGFNAWSGALLFLAAHACAKTAMFLAAGNLWHAAGHDRINDFAGLKPGVPVSVFAFALAGMSLIGLPPSIGFVGKWLLLNAGLSTGHWWSVGIIITGGLLAAAYIGRVLAHAFATGSAPVETVPVPAVMEWTAMGLALLAVLLGFVAGWPLELLRAGAPVTGPVLVGGGGG